MLNDLGVTRFAQIAAWSDADVAEIDPKLGNFAGRIVRDNFVDQARLLAADDIAAFEAKYGKLDAGAR
jgi:predicted flap endonuclease-1-like 5' DNA nuclease